MSSYADVVLEVLNLKGLSILDSPRLFTACLADLSGISWRRENALMARNCDRRLLSCFAGNQVVDAASARYARARAAAVLRDELGLAEEHAVCLSGALADAVCAYRSISPSACLGESMEARSPLEIDAGTAPEGAALESASSPSEKFLGEWKLAAVQVEVTTSVGGLLMTMITSSDKFKMMIGTDGDISVTLEEGGAGIMSVCNESETLSWKLIDDKSIELARVSDDDNSGVSIDVAEPIKVIYQDGTLSFPMAFLVDDESMQEDLPYFIMIARAFYQDDLLLPPAGADGMQGKFFFSADGMLEKYPGIVTIFEFADATIAMKEDGSMMLMGEGAEFSASGGGADMSPANSGKDIKTLAGDILTAEPPWGPERPTFTMKAPPSYPVFNSIIDNPSVGDERFFIRIREAGVNHNYGDEITVSAGKEYEVRIYFHNNAASNLNATGKGITNGARISSQFPAFVTRSTQGKVIAVISATDAEPAEVWSRAYVRTDSPNKIIFRYKKASAIFHNGYKANGSVMSEALFSRKGTYIGLNTLDGWLPSGAEYSGYITYILVAESAEDRKEADRYKEGIARAQLESFKTKFGLKPGRNAPCPCGSGKKFKNCHGKGLYD